MKESSNEGFGIYKEVGDDCFNDKYLLFKDIINRADEEFQHLKIRCTRDRQSHVTRMKISKLDG